MTGPRHTDRRPGADFASRLVSLIWMLTTLSVFQWSVPTVDPALYQLLLNGRAGEAGLVNGDRATAAFVEARATVAVAEKRGTGGRLLSFGSDDAGLVGAPPSVGTGTPFAAIAEASQGDPPRALSEHPFTARGPPAVA